jgi:hypothetical protein
VSNGILRVNKGIGPLPLEGQIVPAGWSNATYGPGQPIRPIDQPWEEGVPREFNFKPSVNTNIIPRTGYGLMPFDTLTSTFNLITEAKQAAHLLTREFMIFEPALVETGTGEQVANDHPDMWMCESPDRQTPWDVWVKRCLQDALAWDAMCLYFDRGAQALRYVAGDTIFVMVDQHGRQPKEGMAFAQVIQGTAFQWFSREELHYQPRQLQLNAPYGMTPLEDAWTWVQIVAQISGFELAYYTEGNTPEGFISAGEESGLNPEQVGTWNTAFNARLNGQAAERRRIQVLPWSNAQWIPTKKADFPKDLYAQAQNNICLAFGVPPGELGNVPGKGLGGSGYMDFNQQAFYRMGLGPLKTYIEGAMNAGRHALGLDPDVRFALQLPTTSIDPSTRADKAIQAFINGVATLNEARAALDFESVEGGDVQVVIRNGVIVSVTDFLKSGLHSPEETAGEAAAAATGSTAQDAKLARSLIESGSLSTTTTSIPESVQTKKVAASKELGASSAFHISKLTGVAESDDAYYGAPAVAGGTVDWPAGGHANDVEIVAIVPPGLPSKPGVWKPMSGENPKLQSRVGGAECSREQAAYLMDRTLQFYCVPVAYVTRVNGEVGSVALYSSDNKPARDAKDYAAAWVERVAVLEYLDGAIDRHRGNWLTHANDELRPVLIDNGLTFPSDNMPIFSPFVEAFGDTEISRDVLAMLRNLRDNEEFWEMLPRLVGKSATALVLERLERVLADGKLTKVSLQSAAAHGGTTTTTSGPEDQSVEDKATKEE